MTSHRPRRRHARQGRPRQPPSILRVCMVRRASNAGPFARLSPCRRIARLAMRRRSLRLYRASHIDPPRPVQPGTQTRGRWHWEWSSWLAVLFLLVTLSRVAPRRGGRDQPEPAGRNCRPRGTGEDHYIYLVGVVHRARVRSALSSARLSISGGSVWSQPSGSRRLGRPHDASVPAVSDEGRPCDCGGTYLTYGRAYQGRRSPNSSLKPIPTARAAPGVRHPRTRNRKRYRARSRSRLLDSGVRSALLRHRTPGRRAREDVHRRRVRELRHPGGTSPDGPRPDPGGKSSRSFRRPARGSSRPR